MHDLLLSITLRLPFSLQSDLLRIRSQVLERVVFIFILELLEVLTPPRYPIVQRFLYNSLAVNVEGKKIGVYVHSWEAEPRTQSRSHMSP